MYSKTVNNRPGGANNESRGRFLWSWYWFLWSWGWFSGNKRSGKPLRLLRLKNHPQDHKNQYQDHKNHPGTRYYPPGTIIERLRVVGN